MSRERLDMASFSSCCCSSATYETGFSCCGESMDDMCLSSYELSWSDAVLVAKTLNSIRKDTHRSKITDNIASGVERANRCFTQLEARH
jgi:hypothetical protein